MEAHLNTAVNAPVAPVVGPDKLPTAEKLPSQEWVLAFIQRSLAEHRVSPSTIEAYTLDLMTLSRWAGRRDRDLLALTADDLNLYFRERVEEGVNASTLARRLSSWRSFYAFLVNKQLLPTNPAAVVHSIHVNRPAPKVLSEDAVADILRPPRTIVGTPADAFRVQRDHALVCMLYGTGLHVGDVRLLKWARVHADSRRIRIPDRNGELIEVTLDPPLLDVLQLLKQRTDEACFEWVSTPFCFPTAAGQPMTRQALGYAVRRRAELAGLPAFVTPAMLHQTGLAHAARGRRQLCRADAV